MSINAAIETFSVPDEAFSISTSIVTGFHAMPIRHHHDKYEIYYLLSGERFYFIKDKTFRIQKGHLIFIHENELHRITDTEIKDHKRILIYFKKPFLASHRYIDTLLELLGQTAYWILSLSVKEQVFIENVLQEIHHEIIQKQPGYEACLQGHLLRILAFIARHFDGHSHEDYLSNNPMHEKVSKIINYMQSHYMQPLTVPAIAGQLFLNPCYLSRLFKKTTGFTLVEYLNSLRTKEAYRLLTQTRMKIVDIAEQTGFGSITQFNRVFKEVMGCSPSELRKKHI